MHLPDGLLPAWACGTGYGLTGLLTWFSLRQINRQADPSQGIPKAALLTAAFFVASSLRIPLPPASVHLVLNGLLGVVLGYYAIPAILVGLFLQAVLLGHGGLTTLGLNTVIMGVPALLAYFLFQLRYHLGQREPTPWLTAIFAFISGCLGLSLALLIFWGLILLTLPNDLDQGAERLAVYGLVIAHLPIVGLEGFFTALLVLFLQRVKPKLIEGGL
ncbi:cobalt transporter CbiM [Synechocystis sp. LKSZ1]|uniref:cobalt transporter CbiM n=1 Tax=Synechocystis sp. LKSZ1 TaxID=3144951 RepID=UPI00336BCB84